MAVKTYSLAKNGSTKLADNFKVKEFKCKDGSDTIKIDTTTVNYLQYARNLIQTSITINSAYRTAAYNKKVGGATNSYHVKGQACDVTSSLGALVLARAFELMGAKGIGYYSYSPFCHVDSRTTKYFWQQDSKNVVYYSKSTFLTTSQIKKVQTYLNKCATADSNSSYNCGTVDGVLGTKTYTAFKYFCKKPASATRRTKMLSYIK